MRTAVIAAMLACGCGSSDEPRCDYELRDLGVCVKTGSSGVSDAELESAAQVAVDEMLSSNPYSSVCVTGASGDMSSVTLIIGSDVACGDVEVPCLAITRDGPESRVGYGADGDACSLRYQIVDGLVRAMSYICSLPPMVNINPHCETL